MLSCLAVLSVAGCTADTDELLALKANAPIQKDALQIMRAKGMTPSAPIMIRIFKEEAILEIWKQKDTGRFDLVKTFPICKMSGEKGPKFKEGDRQAPEGFYYVGRPQLNPLSSYHLSFNLGFPNAYDRAHNRTGTHLMVHGDCSSAGCYAMTDHGIAEIYAFAREALNGGRQEKFLVQAFPFRMTAENMALHRDNKHFEYWEMLKEGYDHFELTQTPPKVDVCEKRYVFNQQSSGTFRASAPCPEMSLPPRLAMAYNAQQTQYREQFNKAVAKLDAKAEAERLAAEKAAAEAEAKKLGEEAAALEAAAANEVQEIQPVGNPAAFPEPPSTNAPIATPVAATIVEPETIAPIIEEPGADVFPPPPVAPPVPDARP